MARRKRVKIPINYALKVSEDSKAEAEAQLERQKVRLDIEVVESLKARYKDVTPLRDSFTHIIKVLKDYININKRQYVGRNNHRSSNY